MKKTSTEHEPHNRNINNDKNMSEKYKTSEFLRSLFSRRFLIIFILV